MAAKTKEYGVYIGGEWVDSTGKGTFETTNPASGKVLATFPNGTKKDVERAVAAAEKAYLRWRSYPAPRRAEIVLKAALVMEERKGELGTLVTREMGKVIAEGRGDVQESIDFLKYISGEGRRLLGERAIKNLKELRQNLGLFTEKEALWVADWLEYLGDPKTARRIRENSQDFKAIIINRYAELWPYHR